MRDFFHNKLRKTAVATALRQGLFYFVLGKRSILKSFLRSGSGLLLVITSLIINSHLLIGQLLPEKQDVWHDPYLLLTKPYQLVADKENLIEGPYVLLTEPFVLRDPVEEAKEDFLYATIYLLNALDEEQAARESLENFTIDELVYEHLINKENYISIERQIEGIQKTVNELSEAKREDIDSKLLIEFFETQGFELSQLLFE